MIAATNGVRLDRDRIQAANLAARELEITRSEFMNSATGATTPRGHDHRREPARAARRYGGRAQPVRRDPSRCSGSRAGTGTSSCDGGATVEYPSLAVDVKVTWPRMESVKPVESHTVLTPPKGSLNSNLGFVGIKVLRADGTPASGQAVNLTGPSSATELHGRRRLRGLRALHHGHLQAGVATTGYVDNFGVAAPTKAVVVQAGKLTQASFNYDAAARIDADRQGAVGRLRAADDPAGPVPDVQHGHHALGPEDRDAPRRATTTVTGLWPFSDGYSLVARLVHAVGPGEGRRHPGGEHGRGARWLRERRPELPAGPRHGRSTAPGRPWPARTVVATPVSTLGCTAPELSGWVVGTTDSSGILRTSLPAGAWTIQVQGKTRAEHLAVDRHLAASRRAQPTRRADLDRVMRSRSMHAASARLRSRLSPARRREAGRFTLIEMIVVVGILGMVLAMVQETMIRPHKSVGRDLVRVDQTAAVQGRDGVDHQVAAHRRPAQAAEGDLHRLRRRRLHHGNVRSVQFYANLDNDYTAVPPGTTTKVSDKLTYTGRDRRGADRDHPRAEPARGHRLQLPVHVHRGPPGAPCTLGSSPAA